MTVFVSTTVEVINESTGGTCLRLPIETNFEIGEPVAIRDDGFSRIGRVCWTSISGNQRLVGFAWLDAETPTGNSTDAPSQD